MSALDDSAPAFPVTPAQGEPVNAYHEGLTKREAYAMAAMQGLIAPSFAGLCSKDAPQAQRDMAGAAVAIADALIVALAK